MADGQNEMAGNRSMLKEFIASVAMIGGDLSNITAPPFVLDTKSTVELPSFWAENPSIFCAPAQSPDPAVRAMLVLKWFLSSLRNQNYMGHSEDHGVKKPLNAFLGEVFLARWEDEMGTTRLVSEQVSHHPPITACRVWNAEHGVSAAGYTRQTITFSGNVTIKQTGHALFTLSKHDNESYLIPLPELKVKGVLTGSPYPELGGKYYIMSTSGYVSAINFSGKSWFGGGSKHAFEAKVYHEDEGEDKPRYILKGTWNDGFTIHDVKADTEIEEFDVKAQSQKTTPLTVEPIEQQDPWETRRAWSGVISALHKGDMKGVVEAKSAVEKGQRQMRKDEQAEQTIWEKTFFTSQSEDEVADTLMRKVPGTTRDLEEERKDTKGVWVFNTSKWEQGIAKPYHGELVPDNSHRPTPPSSTRTSIDSRSDSIVSQGGSAGGASGGGWRWSFSGRRSSVAGSTPPQSRKQSVDIGRRSLDTGFGSSEPRRDSIVSASHDRRPSPKAPSPLSVSQTTLPQPSQQEQPQQDRNEEIKTDTATNIAQTIHKDMPQPQVQQAMQSEKAKFFNTGVQDMSLEEKMSIEEHLRKMNISNQSITA